MYFSENACEVLDTFAMISDQYEDSLGAYVISQCTSASDVLAVLLLQVDAGVKRPLRVVPLFETLDDLRGAASTMEQLFRLPAYIGSINGKQEVMVGYSDSAKDAGRLAASWSQCETQTAEIVLTAHPAQVNRRTLLEKHGRVQRILNEADGLRWSGTPYQRKLLDDALRRKVGSIWQTDELSRSKPSVQSEAERGTLVFKTVMWEALPSFLRRLDATMRLTLGDGRGLPLTACPFKFASWMGGDRDGNPNVTSTVTREVCLTNRIKAARLLGKDVRELISTISGNPPRRSDSDAMDRIRERVGVDARAPFRGYLYPIAARLDRTAEWAEQELHRLTRDEPVTTNITPDEAYLSKDELMDELLTVHRALCETGNAITADGRLSDLIRKLSAFGLTFVPLDVRQESDRHAEVLDGITRYLGLGSYAQWDEGTRVNWISQQLQSRRPLLRSGAWHDHGNEMYFSENACEVLDTFAMISDQYEDSLGAYVISQCTSASDVLAVLLLQVDAGVKRPLRVVPLFETLDDLRGAASTMEQLFRLPAYIGSINGKQEVMVGYSDSAKDAGRLAASWSQCETQVQLAAVARKYCEAYRRIFFNEERLLRSPQSRFKPFNLNQVA
ncbi:hypothetical protein ACHAW5_011036 [Stephanodiscus triporus]|uniref:Phosphoenolpyruvate carboxylase n=1 Tax=Stephanodiscus triporus TaxID=2934178 RepID=A0ABD3P7C7_9STRA